MKPCPEADDILVDYLRTVLVATTPADGSRAYVSRWWTILADLGEFCLALGLEGYATPRKAGRTTSSMRLEALFLQHYRLVVSSQTREDYWVRRPAGTPLEDPEWVCASWRLAYDTHAKRQQLRFDTAFRRKLAALAQVLD